MTHLRGAGSAPAGEPSTSFPPPVIPLVKSVNQPSTCDPPLLQSRPHPLLYFLFVPPLPSSPPYHFVTLCLCPFLVHSFDKEYTRPSGPLRRYRFFGEILPAIGCLNRPPTGAIGFCLALKNSVASQARRRRFLPSQTDSKEETIDAAANQPGKPATNHPLLLHCPSPSPPSPPPFLPSSIGHFTGDN